MLLRTPTSYCPCSATIIMSQGEWERLRQMNYSLIDKLDKFELSGEIQQEGKNWVMTIKSQPQPQNAVSGMLKRVFGREAFLLTNVVHFAGDLKKYGFEVIEP